MGLSFIGVTGYPLPIHKNYQTHPHLRSGGGTLKRPLHITCCCGCWNLYSWFGNGRGTIPTGCAGVQGTSAKARPRRTLFWFHLVDYLVLKPWAECPVHTQPQPIWIARPAAELFVRRPGSVELLLNPRLEGNWLGIWSSCFYANLSVAADHCIQEATNSLILEVKKCTQQFQEAVTTSILPESVELNTVQDFCQSEVSHTYLINMFAPQTIANRPKDIELRIIEATGSKTLQSAKMQPGNWQHTPLSNFTHTDSEKKTYCQKFPIPGRTPFSSPLHRHRPSHPDLMFNWKPGDNFWWVVSTHLENIRQIGNFPK